MVDEKDREYVDWSAEHGASTGGSAPEDGYLDWTKGVEILSAECSGAKALLIAILQDGLRCFFSAVPRVRNEAECWVKSRRRRSPFSFVAVCENLGLDPDAVAAAVWKMRTRNVAPKTSFSRTRPPTRRAARPAGRKRK